MLRPALFRPGVASGSYPERAVGREDWLERAAHDLNGWLRARPGRPSRRAMRFVRAVQGRSLVDMSDDEFTQRVRDPCHHRRAAAGRARGPRP